MAPHAGKAAVRAEILLCMGSTHNGVGREPGSVYATALSQGGFMIFQCMFAVITPELITGAFAERVRFSPRNGSTGASRTPRVPHPGSLSSAHEHMLDGFTEVADAIGLFDIPGYAQADSLLYLDILGDSACNDGFLTGAGGADSHNLIPVRQVAGDLGGTFRQ